MQDRRGSFAFRATALMISLLAREEKVIHPTSHLRKEKPSKRYFNQNTLVKRLS